MMKETKDREGQYYHARLSPMPRDETERMTLCGLRTRKVSSFDWIGWWVHKERSALGLPKCPDCLASSEYGLYLLAHSNL